MPRPEPVFRRADPTDPTDSETCFRLFWASIGDLATRLNIPWERTADQAWPRLEALYGFLADHAAEWWLAEDATDGALLGYARSLERGSLFELTEFFVHPAHQSAGIGRALLERAFPAGRGDVRAIIATSDMRAVARYHRAGTTIQFPILGLVGTPAGPAAPGRLEPSPVTDGAGSDAVASIERTVLGHDRGSELRWLLAQREGYLYREPGGGEPVGFAFVGATGVGPIAALHPRHQADILLHVEDRWRALGRDELSIDVPAPNVVAIRHLLDRGFQLEQSVNFLMASRPFGRFDRFIGYAPPFML